MRKKHYGGLRGCEVRSVSGGRLDTLAEGRVVEAAHLVQQLLVKGQWKLSRPQISDANE